MVVVVEVVLDLDLCCDFGFGLDTPFWRLDAPFSPNGDYFLLF